MALRTQSQYQTVSDHSYDFGHDYQTMYSPYNDQATIHAHHQLPTAKHPVQNTQNPPQLNYDLENLDDLLSIKSLQCDTNQPISQPVKAALEQNVTNGKTHKQQIVVRKIVAIQSPNANNIESIEAKSEIDSQQKPNSNSEQMIGTKDIEDEYVENLYYDDDQTDDPLFAMAAPHLDLTEEQKQAPNTNVVNNYVPAVHTTIDHNNQQQNAYQYQNNGSLHQAYYAPTPHEWTFKWDPSRTPQPQPGLISTPRYIDKTVIQSTLQSVAYCADKLESLVYEYGRCYAEKQQLKQTLLSLDTQSMDPIQYKKYSDSIQSSYNAMIQNLQSFIIGIYQHFTKMKQYLDTRYELQLDHNSRSQFDRFQRLYDQFAGTQHHLLVSAQQLQQQQQYNQQQQQNQYNIPPTPNNYRNRVQIAYQLNQQNNDYQKHEQYYNAMTPRNHDGSFLYYRQQQHNGYNVNYPKTTPAIPNRKFPWNNHKQSQKVNNVQVMKPSSTPKSENVDSNKVNNKKGVDISFMGYVYIGSRIPQLISNINLTEAEIGTHQKRIEMAIENILKSNKNFDKFDIVSYGSSAHKLFIKNYSDFDFCIRCKKLAISHDKAIQYIATALSQTNKNQFDDMKIIDSVDESVHGHYLDNIRHISFFDKISGCSVDLVLNNLPEIGSSRFIAAFESIDPRFGLLCRIIKYWAQQRKINNRLNGTLSTYALVLMVINFLQSRRVLPRLSVMIYDRKTGLSPWSTNDDHQINMQHYKDFAAKNEELPSKLLVKFFYFYGHKFNYDKDVVSVRTGSYLLKSEQKWNTDNNKHWLCIENPFNSKINLTENVNKNNLNRICNEFKRAYSILCESYKIYEVCKSI